MLVTKQKLLRRFWYPVIPVSHLTDGPKPFTLLGEAIVVWRDGEGRVSALEDRCCHRTAALSRGYYENGALVCGYHGWTYDHSGKVLRIPQIERAAPESARVRSHRAAERYGYVWVCLDDSPLLEIPRIAEWDDPALRRIPQFYEVWRCAGLRLMENSFDNAHVNFVHRGTFGDPQDAGESRFEFFEEPWGFRTKTRFPVKQTELASRANRGDRDYGRTTGFRKVPSPPIEISTTSPSWSQRGGVRAAPTPEGVPVRITSPASSVSPCEIQLMSAGTSNTSSDVFDDCSTSPLTLVSSGSPDARSTSSSPTTSGPNGQNVSNDFDHVNCPVLN